MTKRNRAYFTCLSFLLMAFIGCEGMATLFHGSKPEEKIPTCTITFDANGASGITPIAQTVNEGTTIILPSEGGLTFSSKLFTGWCVSPSGAGSTYAVGYSFSVVTNQTLYARWMNEGEIQQYTVTFNANGATSGTPPALQTVYAGISIIVPNQGSLTNTGKNFAGWNTTADGLGTNYIAGNNLVITTDITLYAKWILDPNADTPLPEGTITVPAGALASSLSWITENVQNNKTYYIELAGNESIGPKALFYDGKDNVTIILRGSGANRIVSLNNAGALFTISSGVTLILDKRITLNGYRPNMGGNTSAVIRINSGSTLVMNIGSKITGNRNDGYGDNKGGGVSNFGGTFIMDGGEISGNDSYVIPGSSNFNAGGGVYIVNGVFIMNGGKIINNQTSYNGGGVYCGGTFTMTGGEISNNLSSTGIGAGLYISSGICTISGTAKINENRSPNGKGGGVGINSNAQFIQNGGEICKNNGGGYGGGVYVANGSASFSLNAGIIGNNIGNRGGGVYVENGGFFSKSLEGIIYGSDNSSLKNSAENANYGHAVYIASTPIKKRNSTAGVGIELDSTTSGSDGGWE